MNSYNELMRSLSSVSEQMSSYHNGIDRTLSDVNSASGRVQMFFSNQSAGREILLSISTAEGFIHSADSALYSLNAEILNYINQIRK